MPQFAANLSMLFTEVGFLDRFEKAAAAGFRGVEYLFPYEWDKQLLSSRLEQYQLTQVLHNMPPGDWDAGERGIACLPDRVDEFKQGVDLAIEYALALGCQRLNCLAGLLPPHLPHAQAWDTLIGNLSYAADQLRPHGISLMVEAINSRVDMPGFYLDDSAKVMRAIEETGADNIYLQYDIYHMQIMEGDLARTIKDNLPRIGHIQFADNPGRHEPGSGEINFPYLFAELDNMGYQGWVSAEYRPRQGTEAGLGWMHQKVQR